MKQSKKKDGLYRSIMDLDTIEAEFFYKDGSLFRKNPSHRCKEGTPAIYHSTRYLCVKIKGKAYKAHRVIFMMHYGWCPLMLDHINGNRYDNRIENLRMVDYNANNMNSRSRKGTSSKYKGVSKDIYHSKQYWKAQIQFNKKKYRLGHFADEVVAAKAYDIKAKELFKEYAVLNFP